MLAILLPSALSFGAALRGAGEPPPVARRPLPEAQEAAPAQDGAPRDKTVLSSEAQETLELIRSALHENDREGGRELLRETVAALVDPEPGGEEAHIAFLVELDGLAEELGSLAESRRLCESVLRLRIAILPSDHRNLRAAKLSLARTRKALGDLAGARELEEEVLAACTLLLPADHPELLWAKLNLAATRHALGDLAGARELSEEVLEARTRLLPPDHPNLLTAKLNAAATRAALGDLAGARELQEEVLTAWTRLLAPDHPDLLIAKNNLAVTRKDLGDLAGAHALLEEVHEAFTRLLPPDHPHLLAAKQNLAATKDALGDLAGARELNEEVLAARTRLLPPDHPDLLTAKLNVAETRAALRDLAGARELQEEVLAARTRLFPPDHPDLLRAKLNLAAARHALRDLAGARELEEEVLEARTRLLPADHPELLLARHNLAVTRAALGDLAGARELEEEVLAARTRLLPADHPDLLRAKQGLAVTREALGDLAGAHELMEEVLAAWTRLLPPDHPDLLRAKLNLAATRHALGDLAGAHELEEEVLAARTRLLPADHPDLLEAKQGLAATRWELGDVAGAHELFEEVLAARTRLLPADHSDLLEARQNLAVTRKALGDYAGARELVSSMLAGVRARASALSAEAARPARECARAELGTLHAGLFLSAATDPEGTLAPELFATLEELRLASVASSEMAHALGSRPELAELARALAERRARLNDRVAAGPAEGESADEWRKEVVALAEERDLSERELREKMATAGVFMRGVEAKELGARLAPGTVAVSFLRYPKSFDRDPETGKPPPTAESLLAFVVKPGGAASRIELGPAGELEELVGEWRRALGRPLAGRGIAGTTAAGEGGEEEHETLGTRLREKVLGPVLAGAGELHALHVVLDDVLHLVPLDALPLEEGLVGDRIAIRNEVTLARLLRERAPLDAGGALTLAGGLDYEVELGEGALLRLDASTPPLEDTPERSGGSASRFAFLPGTTAEAESIAAMYAEAFEREVAPLSGATGTKAALFAAAPKTRFLHLATHGWFASETFKSQLDTLAEQSTRDSWQRAEETLAGFAPETLCGLALAGANRGKDALGRVPGILTAEELASFDLRNCELAVLSACETNVGIRRAGQGIQSLQTALHAAGARTAITSLWKVDDAATRRLFELFYSKLWKEKLGKADALWQAKMALRAEGHPPRDWAGWVLSGDPE